MRIQSATAGASAAGSQSPSTDRPSSGRPSGVLSLGAVSPGLAAYRVASAEPAGQMAGLLAELLLGKTDPRWSAARWTAGETRVGTRNGEVQLRRGGTPVAPRLTLSAVGDRPSGAPHPSPSDWQSGVPASVLSAVFFADPNPIDPLRALLSSPVAEAFTKLSSRRTRRDAAASGPNRRPAEELLRRRDDLANRIETLLATRRQESGDLDKRLVTLDADHHELSARVNELRSRVRTLAEQLDAEGARVRYEELTRVAAEAEGRQAADDWGPRVEELDEEVSRWRATLAELESREAYVRGELARVRPDDAAPQLVVADQRASIAVAKRLVADLESEVSRFARSGDSPLCVCQDAHPRLNPLVETLGRHLDRLSSLIAQQEHALRTQELMSEAAQLERSQTELRRQLDHLLERRQTLWRSSRARNERLPEAYLGTFDRTTVEHDHRALSEELAGLESQLEAIDRERHTVAERRRRLLDAGQLGEWQRELDLVQAELARATDYTTTTASGSLRASDVLARLSDGEFVELRLAPGGRSVEARDRSGRLVRQEELSTVSQRLVAWALRLALADACHAAEVPFTMVLDQPFADLDDRFAANLATCLDDYARRGRQVVLFDRDGAGLHRLRSLGVTVHSLDGGAVRVAPAPKPVPPPTPKTVVREETVTREWLLDVDDPIERFPVPLADRHAAFARSRIRTVGDLIGGDPSAIAEEIAIDGVTAELVSLWQAHVALVCFTRGLDLQGAKHLVDCDILSVEELADADADHLARAMRKRGASQEMLRRVERWVESAASGVSRWRSTGYSKSWSRNRKERRDRIRDNAHRRGSDSSRSIRIDERSERDSDYDRRERSEHGEREGRGHRRRRRSSSSSSSSRSSSDRSRTSSSRRSATSSSSEKKTLRFYLNTTDEIEAAPSIGAKRASQLTAIGYATVAQFLAGDPEEIATKLDDSRVDAATIVAWQNQSELMCCVPGLRGHDAQVLVGVGLTSPEEIASMKPTDLLEFVDPFCDTTEGQRALRGSARPDLAEVTEWIQGARQRRPVGAA